MSLCPCCSGLPLEECCRPILDGTKKAPTAEALMRARYSAHCLGEFDFLAASMHPSIREETSPEEMKAWAESLTWSGLEILETSGGGEQDERGCVSFIARYGVKGLPQELREDAQFVKEDGQWYYADGHVHPKQPLRRENPKVGRNDPCPCGSGKKYKKCCGANAA